MDLYLAGLVPGESIYNIIIHPVGPPDEKSGQYKPAEHTQGSQHGPPFLAENIPKSYFKDGHLNSLLSIN